jgi:hypothetical protein
MAERSLFHRSRDLYSDKAMFILAPFIFSRLARYNSMILLIVKNIMNLYSVCSNKNKLGKLL